MLAFLKIGYLRSVTLDLNNPANLAVAQAARRVYLIDMIPKMMTAGQLSVCVKKDLDDLISRQVQPLQIAAQNAIKTAMVYEKAYVEFDPATVGTFTFLDQQVQAHPRALRIVYVSLRVAGYRVIEDGSGGAKITWSK